MVSETVMVVGALHCHCHGTEHYHYDASLILDLGIRGDLLRSVPFIMCGHSNIEFFQASASSILTRNPLRTCLMMILRHSGRAPKPFVHPFHGMSYHDMSRHDNQKLRLLF